MSAVDVESIVTSVNHWELVIAFHADDFDCAPYTCRVGPSPSEHHLVNDSLFLLCLSAYKDVVVHVAFFLLDGSI